MHEEGGKKQTRSKTEHRTVQEVFVTGQRLVADTYDNNSAGVGNSAISVSFCPVLELSRFKAVQLMLHRSQGRDKRSTEKGLSKWLWEAIYLFTAQAMNTYVKCHVLTMCVCSIPKWKTCGSGEKEPPPPSPSILPYLHCSSAKFKRKM